AVALQAAAWAGGWLYGVVAGGRLFDARPRRAARLARAFARLIAGSAAPLHRCPRRHSDRDASLEEPAKIHAAELIAGRKDKRNVRLCPQSGHGQMQIAAMRARRSALRPRGRPRGDQRRKEKRASRSPPPVLTPARSSRAPDQCRPVLVGLL